MSFSRSTGTQPPDQRPESPLHTSGRRFDTVRAHQRYRRTHPGAGFQPNRLGADLQATPSRLPDSATPSQSLSMLESSRGTTTIGIWSTRSIFAAVEPRKIRRR